MSEITLLAWNVCDGISDDERSAAIAEKVAEYRPDLAIFSEGARAQEDIPDKTARILGAFGLVYAVPYGDTDGRNDRHQLITVAHRTLDSPEVFHGPGGRASMIFQVNDVKVVGFHGYDRHGEWPGDPEEARVQQIRALHEKVGTQGRAIFGGDTNFINPNDPKAPWLRLVQPLASLLPARDPGEYGDMAEMSSLQKVGGKILRIGSKAQRLTAMAEGRASDEMRRYGYSDADPSGQPTMEAGPLAVQLDHFYACGVTVTDFEVIPHEGLSDHDAIMASFTV